MLIRILAVDQPTKGRSVGDVISYRQATDRPYGAREDKRRWVALGRDPAEWPGYTAILDIPQITPERAKRLRHIYRRLATQADDRFNSPDRMDRVVRLGKGRRFRVDVSGSGPLTNAQRIELRDNAYLLLPSVNRAFINQLIIDRQSLDDFDPAGDPVNEDPPMRPEDTAPNLVGLTLVQARNNARQDGHDITKGKTPLGVRINADNFNEYRDQQVLQQRPTAGDECGLRCDFVVLVMDL